jgi:O-antigen/teichoic acid export membrane protein
MARLLREGTLSGNTVANLGGRLLPGVLTVAVVPLLLPLIGNEGYGVIGLYATFQIVFATLEVGLSITATRQVARNLALSTGGDANRSLLRTLELVYWGAGVVIALGLAACASWVAEAWINADELGHDEIRNAIIAAGVAIAARWPISLYKGVLDGLQFQVTQNAVTIGTAVLRIGVALPFVAWIYPSVAGFMLWQAWASLVEVAVMGFFAWRALGGNPTRARFDGHMLKTVWRFAASLTVISALGAALTQADKFVISNRLPLEDLGYYTLAMTAVGPLPLVAAAVAAAVLPRFSGQLARDHSNEFAVTYRQAVDAVGFIAVWGSLPLAFFSHEILLLWTRSTEVADSADTVLTLLALAFLLNALYAIPYTVILSAGRTRIPLIVNAVSAPLVLGVTYLLVPPLGLVGAAAIWLVVMAIHLAVYGVWAHRMLMPNRFAASLMWPARFAAVGVALFAFARFGASQAGSEGMSYVIALTAMVVTGIVGIRSSPADLRQALLRLLARRRSQPGGGLDPAVRIVPDGAVEPK